MPTSRPPRSLLTEAFIGGNKLNKRKPDDWPVSVNFEKAVSKYTWLDIDAVSTYLLQKAAPGKLTPHPTLAPMLEHAAVKIAEAKKRAGVE